MKKVINALIVVLIFVLVGLIGWQYLQGTNSNDSETAAEPEEIITELTLTIDDPYAFFDGERVMIDEDNSKIMPIIVDERTMLPLRFVAESFGMSISWNDETREITLSTKDGFDIRLTIGSKSAQVNNKTVDLDSPAVIIEERTFLPLRFVAEQMNCDVSFDDETREIKISYNNVELTPEQLEARKLLIQDRTVASTLSKAAAKLLAQDSKYQDSIDFSHEVIIDIELIRPFLPDPTADFSVINTGVAPWIISAMQGEYKVTDSSDEKKVFFQGKWENITPPPKPTSTSTPTPTPTAEEATLTTTVTPTLTPTPVLTP